MKSILGYVSATVFALIMCAIACTKANDSATVKKHQKEIYFVGAIETGGDTSWTPGMVARAETIGLEVVEDSKLKAELMAYQNISGVAHYIVKITNKQSCQMILRWNWDELGITSIEPLDSTAHTLQSDVIKGNQIKTYEVIGLPKLGRIYVKGEHSNSDCPNSSQLIINITTSILPIKYYAHTATYDAQKGSTLISVDVDDPTTIEYFILQKQNGDGTRALIGSQKCDKVKKHWEFLIYDEEK